MRLPPNAFRAAARLASLLLLCLAANAQESRPGARPDVTFEELARGFSEPSWAHAPFMFWFWDVAPPDPDVVEQMAERLLDVGINPGYVHARPPVVPHYPADPTDPDHPVARGWLGEEWFAAFDRVVAAADRRGAHVGFCDDVWWPSLRAAGRVLERHPELRAQSLAWRVLEGTGTLEVPECDFALAARRAPFAPATSVIEGSWIGPAEPQELRHDLWLRRELDIASPVKSAELRIAASGPHEVHVGTRSLAPGGFHRRARVIDLAPCLAPGTNVIEIRIEFDDPALSGARIDLTVHLEDGGVVEASSDARWSTSLDLRDGIGRRAWTSARECEDDLAARCAAAMRPDPFAPVEIESATLRRIGGGEAFTWETPDEGLWRIYTFELHSFADVNRLDRRVAPAFIELAIEPYLERYSDQLGRTLSGVFVDNEGDYGKLLAWSDDLAAHFRESTESELRLQLPLLLDRDIEGSSARVRVAWFRSVSALYVANYGAVVERLERAGLHVSPNFWEESLSAQATHVGDVMAMQRRFSMTGTDCLRMDALDPRHFAEARSVAELEGRRSMTEFLGAGRWSGFDPIKLKTATNAIHAWGVSHVVPHGLFLRRELTQNPWTPDWYDENPLFRHLEVWSRFTRRASYLQAHGRAVVEVLVLHPQESVWAVLGPGVFDARSYVDAAQSASLFDTEVQLIEQAYTDAIRVLAEQHVESIIGDSAVLDACEAREGALVHGTFAFRTVVLPPLVVLPRATAAKLVDLAYGGGHVFAMGSLPRGSTEQGFGDPALAGMMERLANAPGFRSMPDLGAAIGALPGLEPCARVVDGAAPKWIQRKRIDGRDVLWIASDVLEPCRFTLFVPRGTGRAAVWDCERGTITEVGSRQDASGAWIDLELAPLEAIALSLDPARAPLDGPGRRLARTVVAHELEGPWRARIEDSVQPTIEVQFKPAPGLGLPDGVEVSLVPWRAWGFLDHRFVGHIDYHATFELDDELAARALTLDLGVVHDVVEVHLNDTDLGARLWPPHTFDVEGALRPGKNEVRVRVGNLVQNAYIGTRFGAATDSGLIGPVRLLERLPESAAVVR